MLITTAFPIPRSLLGEAWAYPLAPDFRAELTAIGKRWRVNDNEHARAPHASLATALRAVTGQPVKILPRTRHNDSEVFLVTSRPCDSRALITAVSAWERLARRGENRNVLAAMLDCVTPRPVPLTRAIDNPRPGRVAAEHWVYEVLGWLVAEQISAQPISFDHMNVPFRIDTDGALVAWDNPITKPRGNRVPARGLMKITPHIRTLAGTSELVCIFEASITRLVDRLYQVKSVWIEHGRAFGGTALLRMPIVRVPDGRQGWRSVFRDYSPGVVAACGLTPLPWAEDILATHPSQVRGWRAANDEHPIGTGVGPRTYRFLVDHVSKLLDTEPLTYQPSGTRVPAQPRRARPTPAALDSAIAAAGPPGRPACQRLHIVHLSASPTQRLRVRDELAHYQADGVQALAADLGAVQQITPHVSFAAYDIADLLAHGCTDRSEILAKAPSLKHAANDTLTVALVETEYASGMKIPDDAKPPLRRSLAELGVATQFLATQPAPGGTLASTRQERPPRSRARPQAVEGNHQDDRDYPAESAIKDLFRVAGLTDDRLHAAVTSGTHPLTRDAWLVGVHVRRQNSPHGSRSGGGTTPVLATVLAAVRAHTDPEHPWTFHIYIPGQGWAGHAAGTAAFHARPIGIPLGDSNAEQAAYQSVRDLTDQALAELGEDTPVTVLVDAEATRRIWAGLTDAHFGTGPLPGDTLPTAASIAVVRISAEDTAVPRPVHRTDGQQARSGDTAQPATPGNRIYVRETDDGTRTWLLGRTSRTYSADQAGRCGARYTRFTLPEGQQQLQGKPWHSFTATEFAVARSGPFSEQELVATAARLCAQPASWDAHTRWPVPLHSARIADQTHPSWRGDETSMEPRGQESDEAGG